MNDLDFAVKFPFTEQAKDIIKELGVELNEMTVSKAVERIKSCLGGNGKKSIALHESEKIQEIASYAAARILLGYMQNRYLTNKFAVAESKIMASLLDKQEEITGLEEFFKIKKIEEENKIYLSLPSFLKFAPKSIEYKIINRQLKKGKVLINHREEIRIIEEAIRKYLEKIPRVTNPSQSIKNAETELKELLPKIEPQKMSLQPGDNPPCIEKIMERLVKHENLSHQERFFLGTYLVNRGMKLEKIVSLYENLPDFDERITTYQIEHIIKRGYVAPSCSKILSYGLCCADCRIGNPLNWRSKSPSKAEGPLNWKSRKQDKKESGDNE